MVNYSHIKNYPTKRVEIEMLKTTVHETHGNYQRVLSKKIMEMVKQLFNVSLVYL